MLEQEIQKGKLLFSHREVMENTSTRNILTPNGTTRLGTCVHLLAVDNLSAYGGHVVPSSSS